MSSAQDDAPNVDPTPAAQPAPGTEPAPSAQPAPAPYTQDHATTAVPAAADAQPAPIWAAAAPPPPVDGALPPPARRSSRLKLGIVAAVSAVIVIGGGIAVAYAASDSNAVQNDGGKNGRGNGFAGGAPGGGQGMRGNEGQGNGQGGNNGQGGQGLPGGQGFPGGGFGRGGGGTLALGGALHGDFVIRNGNGQYVTERLQSGTVTEVSATSITAKSEDGHGTTYVVGADTKINSGASKIADVKAGDSVTVIGVVSGDTATATEVTDIALLRQGNGGNNQRRGATPQPTRTT